MESLERRLYCGKCSYTKVYKAKALKPVKCPKCGRVATYYKDRGFNWKKYIIEKIADLTDLAKGFIFYLIALLLAMGFFGFALWLLFKIVQKGVECISVAIHFMF